jgi:predicted GNAT family N-acyltransferase
MLHITTFKSNNSKLAKEAFRIREEVFVKEQNVDPAIEYDTHENESIHYLAFWEGYAVATARRRRTKYGIKLERFATLPEYRNKGIGSSILKHILGDIKDTPELVYLHSQIAAIPFYQKHHFVSVGNIFTEAGIQHFKMIWNQKHMQHKP